ncbi:hypothetical protein LUU34_01090600 [Aix galericulata]|nr:hypothetical protein LUU34_01090600 [Aix galericulata]
MEKDGVGAQGSRPLPCPQSSSTGGAAERLSAGRDLQCRHRQPPHAPGGGSCLASILPPWVGGVGGEQECETWGRGCLPCPPGPRGGSRVPAGRAERPPEPLPPNQPAFNMTMAVTVPSSRGRPGEDIKHPQAPPNGVSACGRRPGLGVRARP